jgi:hypothetical protein
MSFRVIKLSVIRPALYTSLVVAALIGTYVYKLRTEGIFACAAAGYPTDGYLGYCDAGAYGDYDHGALWFGMEPEAERFARNADVLFIGNSRMQFGFSSAATDDWFLSAGAQHYLLGFSHLENETFLQPLLERLKPRARVYVINVDRFFDDVESEPGGEILHGSDMKRRYAEKGLWQQIHRAICVQHLTICGHRLAFYRFRKNGHWQARSGDPEQPLPIADAPPSEQELWGHYAALARQFVARLPVDRACIVLTDVPSPATKSAEARAIAAALGLNLADPALPGLQTFDETHLSNASAERWSKAFFDIAGPRIRQCLKGTTPSSAG